MKASFYVGIILISGANAFAASVKNPLSQIPGSLENVHCVSVFEGNPTDRVRVISRVRDTDHYVVGMVLKVHWLDRKQKQHLTNFTIAKGAQAKNAETLFLSAASPQGHHLDLEIDVETLSDSNIDPTTAYFSSQLRVDGVVQDYLKFICNAPIAG